MLCQELALLTTYPRYGHVHILTRKVSITSHNHHHHSHPHHHHQCHHILTRKVGVGISHQLRLIRVKRSQVPGPLLLHISTLRTLELVHAYHCTSCTKPTSIHL